MSDTSDIHDHRQPLLTGISVLALSFAAGIALGWHLQTGSIAMWAVVAVIALITFWVAIRRRWTRHACVILLAIIGLSLGAIRMTAAEHRVADDDLYLLALEEPTAVRIHGDALSAPRHRDHGRGSMSAFDYRPPVTTFRMKVHGIELGGQHVVEMRGEVFVRVNDVLLPFFPGDSLHVAGTLRPPPPKRNPGEFDLQRYARSLGQAGTLFVPHRDGVEVLEVRRSALRAWWQRVHYRLRTQTSSWLLGDLPTRNQTEREALLAALLLGERGPDLDELGEAFRRVGLAHLLAISGLHLGILAGLILIILNLIGVSSRGQGWIMIAAILGYLVLIEVRLPVLRAGIMTIFACLALAMGKRMAAGSLVAMSGFILLLWRPDQIVQPGFQLSFGVVLGLLYLASPVRERWFGQPEQDISTHGEMIGQWLRSGFAAAVVAWLVATPIVLYHFGHIAPLAAPMSVVALPLVAILLAFGYLKMLLGALLPSAALLVGIPLSISADLLTNLVWTIDHMPLSTLYLRSPGLVWTAAALAWIIVWALTASRWRRTRFIWPAGVALAGWLGVLALAPATSAALRIDMLSVGEGSCYLLRSGRSTVLFDAGSYSALNVGNRTIVPALRRLGVNRLDAIIISHPHFDHFSAVLEVVDHFDVHRVLVAQQFEEVAKEIPHGAAAYLLRELDDRWAEGGPSVQQISAGWRETFGRTMWTALHPKEGERFALVNDESLVIAIDIPTTATHRRVLLTGDIEERALEAIVARGTDLSADIIELPHHGSSNDLASEFVERVQPSVVLQSCGPRRLENDTWQPYFEDRGISRFVTARDGFCTVEVNRRGEIRVTRFLGEVGEKWVIHHDHSEHKRSQTIPTMADK